jgi:hypothetical protein
LSFDGADDVVRAAQVPSTGPLTVEAWVRPAVNNEDGVVIAAADDDTGWSLELNNGRLTFWVSTSQGWRFSRDNTTLQAGQWYHVAATYDNGTAYTFVNGNRSSARSVGTLIQGPSLRFGGVPGYFYFGGALDEVHISNVVRYAGDFSVPTAPFTADANTLGLWHLDEGSGQIATDVSASANSGTLGNSGNVDGADPTWVEGYPFPALAP